MWAGTIMQASHMPLCRCTPFQNNSTSPRASPKPTPGSAGAQGPAVPTEPWPRPCPPPVPALPRASSPRAGRVWGEGLCAPAAPWGLAVPSLAKVGAWGDSPRMLWCSGGCLAIGAGTVLLFRGQIVTLAINHIVSLLGRAVPCLRGRCGHGCQNLLRPQGRDGLTGAQATRPLPHPAFLPAGFLLLSWSLAGPCVRLRAAGHGLCGCWC